MRQARVLTSELPKLMRDIVRGTVETCDDMRSIGECRARTLSAAVTGRGADVVVMPEGAVTPDELRVLLAAHPGLEIVVITDQGRSAVVYQCRRSEIADLSPTTLADAIRASFY